MEITAFGWSVMAAAAGIAVTHTVLGPDHYLPFVMLSRARGWSMARTLAITAACGVGHVASSVLLGAVGIALGVAVAGIESLESGRGDLAAWALVAFGLAYAVWGARRAVRRARGIEPHEHGEHVHLHVHGVRPHTHGGRDPASATSFWALFVIFVLGPCEPLIPLFVLPASRGAWTVAALTAAVFGIVTLATMLVLVAVAAAGAARLPLGPLERWSHALAGGVIAGSGLAIIYLGL